MWWTELAIKHWKHIFCSENLWRCYVVLQQRMILPMWFHPVWKTDTKYADAHSCAKCLFTGQKTQSTHSAAFTLLDILFLWFKFKDEMIDLLTRIERTHVVDIVSRAVNASIRLSDSSYVFNKRYLFILFSSTSVHEMFCVDVVAARVHSTNGKFQFWTFQYILYY